MHPGSTVIHKLLSLWSLQSSFYRQVYQLLSLQDLLPLQQPCTQAPLGQEKALYFFNHPTMVTCQCSNHQDYADNEKLPSLLTLSTNALIICLHTIPEASYCPHGSWSSPHNYTSPCKGSNAK